MILQNLNLYLADDDKDDCLLFQEALEELPLETHLSVVNNGEQLMIYLHKEKKTPGVLFLDLNMPRKNGFECLLEIMQNNTLKNMPVIIFSTSFDREIVSVLHENGARYYIRKPDEFEALKNVIHKALISIRTSGVLKPSRENFVLQS